MSDQTIATQLRRLKKGCCPIHGYGLSQVDGYRYDIDGKDVGEDGKFCIAGCPAKNCEVRVTATGPDIVAKLISPVHLVERLEVRRSPV